MPGCSTGRALLLALLLALSAASSAAGQVFFVIGDTGDCTLDGTAQVAAALRQQADWAQASLIEVGDLGYPVATGEQLLGCHERHFTGFAGRLAVPGNHDWHAELASGFFSIFPQALPRVDTLGAGWRLVLLNSNLRDEAATAQLDWLDKTLPAQRGHCLIAAWHHPRWSSGKHGDNRFVQALWARLQGQASLTLHGHDHHFEAIPPRDAEGAISADGIPSFISGHGGARLYGPGWGAARSQQAHYGQWGFMRLELDGAHYRWQAYAVSGQRLAAGEGRCRPAGVPHAPR